MPKLPHYDEIRTATRAYMAGHAPNLSQADVAQQIGSTQVSISEFLNEGAVLRREALERLVRILARAGIYNTALNPKRRRAGR